MDLANKITINDNNIYCDYIECTKKIKLTDYECKCKKFYCKKHKLPEIHKCEYDYKEAFKKNKKIEDLKCFSVKIQKIS